jgi:hypothetical protein
MQACKSAPARQLALSRRSVRDGCADIVHLAVDGLDALHANAELMSVLTAQRWIAMKVAQEQGPSAEQIGTTIGAPAMRRASTPRLASDCAAQPIETGRWA